jgi:hypothetical protein
MKFAMALKDLPYKKRKRARKKKEKEVGRSAI